MAHSGSFKKIRYFTLVSDLTIERKKEIIFFFIVAEWINVWTSGLKIDLFFIYSVVESFFDNREIFFDRKRETYVR